MVLVIFKKFNNQINVKLNNQFFNRQKSLSTRTKNALLERVQRKSKQNDQTQFLNDDSFELSNIILSPTSTVTAIQYGFREQAIDCPLLSTSMSLVNKTNNNEDDEDEDEDREDYFLNLSSPTNSYLRVIDNSEIEQRRSLAQQQINEIVINNQKAMFRNSYHFLSPINEENSNLNISKSGLYL
jgi:hypothetical protein